MSVRFKDVIVPLLTPLDADERIDRPALLRTIEFLIGAGVHGIFVLGSNGEGPALRPAERKRLVVETVAAVAGRVDVIAGAIEPSTARVIDEIGNLADCGLAGFVATTPFYYSGYSDTELVAHFRASADAAPAPLLVYNIPQNTKIPVRAAVVAALAGTPNVAGLKDSSGDWTEFQSMLLDPRRPRDFVMLQGMQSLSAVSMLVGADGLIPGHANVCPELLVQLCNAARSGRMDEALAKQAQLDRLLAIRGRAVLHANKLVASRLGLMQDNVTRPLPRLSAAEAEMFLRATAAAGIEFPRTA
jgi:4-hydroxy-tetrahydrodipicolinate synthase